MSQENQITLRGYLTAEPKFYQKTPLATPVTEIRVGCTPRRLNRETGEWHELPTSYYRVRCWRRLAINTASSLHKGDRVFIRGHFYTSTWVDNQERPRSTLEIEADTIGHDLAYGWSHYMRGTRPSEESAPAEKPGRAFSKRLLNTEPRGCCNSRTPPFRVPDLPSPSSRSLRILAPAAVAPR